MTMRAAVTLAVAAAAGFGLAGCPANSCPLESPQVSATPATCTELANQPVSYPVRLCPTCNQTSATCVPDLSAVGTTGDIYLDLKVDACTDANSCGGAACQLNSTTCNFTAPGAGTYHVIAYDPVSNTTITHDLVVIASGGESCAL